MKTYYFALDFKYDPEPIAEYRRYHQMENVWPAVPQRIRGDGVPSEEIYLAENRMVMILKTGDDFSLDAKIAADRGSAEMQEWEKLMAKFQQLLPIARPGRKWVPMKKIFEVK